MSDAPTPSDVIESVPGFGEGQASGETIVKALTAAGYAVVPVEATQAIITAAAQLDFSAQTDPTWPEFYRAMIAAAIRALPDA